MSELRIKIIRLLMSNLIWPLLIVGLSSLFVLLVSRSHAKPNEQNHERWVAGRLQVLSCFLIALFSPKFERCLKGLYLENHKWHEDQRTNKTLSCHSDWNKCVENCAG